MSDQLNELNTLSDLISVDGEIGQPRLRQSCEQLHVVLDRKKHLLVLLVLRGSKMEVVSQLNGFKTKVESMLTDTLDELEQLLESARIAVELDAFVLLPNIVANEAQSLADALPMDQTLFAESVDGFPQNAIEDLVAVPDQDFDRLRNLLFPKREWNRVRLVHDEGRLARRGRRVELQKEFLDACWGLNATTTIIEGGPGTGKSLMLVSRGLWLASALPDSNIVVVTWNRSLAEAIECWLRDINVASSNIEVVTVAEFLQRHEIDLDLTDPADADARCKQLLGREKFEQCYDAILIDEAQDLGSILLTLLNQFLKVNRGGLTITMDSSQNVRSRPLIDQSCLPGPVELFTLSQCYRSTSAIRWFCGVFAGYDRTQLKDPQGEPEEPVQLVWAESPEQCTAMILSESFRLMRDVGLEPHEIMVVAFDGQQRRQISKAFEQQGQKTSPPGKAGSSDRSVLVCSPEVAKGHEASCVFVVGWDTPASNGQVQAARRFVAASRAADILYVVYSSQEGGRLLSESDSRIHKQLWPDDFEKAA